LGALLRDLRPGSIAVDGSANMGLHTVQMAQAVLPDGLAMAIERVGTGIAGYCMPAG
jgi:hypothetical protein